VGAFTAPLIVFGIGLVGQWLMGPKKSPTAAPDGMPMLNGALRGSTMPITFGSNRVSAQIVWSNNFRAVRQQSSGKGGAKGGGSGGMGSAKGGGSAGVGYMYFWDLMFNFGMMDQPSMIGRGWVGGDQLDHATLNALTSGLGSELAELDPEDKSAHLSFTESFFAPGFNAGEAGLETWPYFENQMGYPCAWPSTAWVGFNQLQLGQAPVVPQLSLELVPLSQDIAPPPTSIIYDNSPNPSIGEMRMYGEEGGDVWSLQFNSGVGSDGGFRVIRPRDGLAIDKTDAETTADVAAVAGAGSSARNAFILAGTPYIYNMYLYDDLTNPKIVTMLYKIEDEEVNLVGNMSFIYNGGFRKTVGQHKAFAVLPSGDVAYAYTGRSIDVSAYITTLKGPEWIIENSGTILSAAIGDVSYNIPDSDFLFGGNTGSNHSRQIVIVPDGSANGFKVVQYVSRAEAEYELSHSQSDFIADAAATHPDGGFHFSWSCAGGVDVTFDGINQFFSDADFADAGKDHAGGYTDENDDWFLGTYANGSVIIARTYSDLPGTARLKSYNSNTGLLLGEFPVVFSTPEDWGDLTTTDMQIWSDTEGVLWGMFDRATGAADSTRKHVQLGLTGGTDVTPPYIIKRILTSEIFGFATTALFGFTVTEDRIDQVSYLNAHTYCIEQGFVFSVTYEQGSDLLTILNELVQLYGGYLTERGGMIYFNTVKASDDPVRTIDNTHFVIDKGKPPVSVTKAALEDGYNKIQFNYLDREIEYKQNQIQAADEVDIDLNGPRVKTFQARYVMNGSVAQTIATRALWSNLYGRDQYQFALGWKDADLGPGDLITLVDSFDPTLSAGVRARITHWQEVKRGRFQVEATREFGYIVTASAFFTSQTSIDPGYNSLVKPAAAPAFQTAYELPKEFQGAKSLLYFGYNQAQVAMGAQLHLSTDGENYILTQDEQPYMLGGLFMRKLENRPKGYVDEDIDFWLLPTLNFDANSPTFIQEYELDDFTPAVRAGGGAVFIVGSEAIGMQNLTLLGQNHYRAKRLYRGWGGSPISAHNSGSYFHYWGAGVFAHEITQDMIGTNISYKITPYNFAGVAYDITSVQANTYTIKGLYWLPREQPDTKVFVNSAKAWSANTPVVGPYLGVTSGGSDFSLRWPASANEEGYGAGGFGTGGFGHFINTDSVNYRVDVASRNGTKVASYVVTTGYFEYNLALNSADFSGVARDMVFTVTPFTVKGDGPVASVRSLSLNW
jgi:polyisoprenoid-binding protein YceI